MNPYAPRQITVLQYIFFIHGAQLGIGILTMPKDLAKISGTDGWIGILLGWLVAVAASLIIIGIMKKYPNFTIVDLLPKLFGKWAGKLFIFVLFLYLGYATMTVLVDTVAILRLWLLPQTPFFYTMMLLLVPILFLIGKGVKTLGRYAELISYASLWVPIALFYSIKEPQFLYLLPVLKEGWGPVLKTVPSTVLSFLGFELAFFLYPYLQKKQFASLGIVIANTLSMMVFMVVTVVAYIVFSPDEVQRLSHPSLSMWRGVEYRFLERIDILFLAFYLFMISTTWMPYMYFTVFSAGKIWAQPNERGYLIAFMLLLVLGVFLYTPSYLEVLQLRKIWGQLGMVLGYLVPLLLWGYVHIYDFFQRRRMP